MTFLQIRTAPPKAVSASDALGLVDQAMGFVSAGLPKAVALAYFVVVCVILWRVGRAAVKRQLGAIPTMEWVGIGILFGLMR